MSLSGRRALSAVVLVAGCSPLGLRYQERDLDACGPECPTALDPTFAAGGVFRLDVGGVDNVDWAGQGLALEPDGDIVLAGTAGTAARRGLLVVRLQATGALDPTFGAGGLAAIDLDAGAGVANSVRVQSDDGLVVVGAVGSHAAVVRLQSTGAPDPAFGANGAAPLVTGTDTDLANGQATLADGRLRVCGHGRVAAASPTDMLVFGYLADGAVDGAFGTAGLAVVDFFGDDELASCAFADARGLLVLGTTWHGAAGADFGLARLGADGAYDPTFTDAAGLPGRVAVDFSGGDDYAQACVPQQDGKILCCGSTTTAGVFHHAVARLLADGTLDPTFGDAGRVVVDMGGEGVARDLVVLPDGRIIVGGYARSPRGDDDFALVMLAADGSIRTDFATGGKLLVDVGTGNEDQLQAVALDAAGRLLLFGSTASAASNNDLAVVRLDLGTSGPSTR